MSIERNQPKEMWERKLTLWRLTTTIGVVPHR